MLNDMPSKPDAIPLDDPRFGKLLQQARDSITAVLDKFELETGRVVSGISIDEVDITMLMDSSSQFVRGEAYITWNHTAAELEEMERVDKEWSRRLKEKGGFFL